RSVPGDEPPGCGRHLRSSHRKKTRHRMAGALLTTLEGVNMRRAQWTIMLAAILLAGCATVAVERAKDLSSAGLQYSQATAAVIDVASDAAVDADSEAQVTSKPRQPV